MPMLADMLINGHYEVGELLQLTLHSDNNMAFRAAWLLEMLFVKNAQRLTAYFNLLIAHAGQIKCHSCQRHYAKIYRHITGKKAHPAIKTQLQVTLIEPVIEQSFDWLINPKVKVAVKAFASETLFNLIDREPWIAEELQTQLNYLMINGSPAIKATGRRLLSAMTIG